MSNGHPSTEPDKTNIKYYGMPIHLVYILDKIWRTVETQATATQGQGTPGYVPDYPPIGRREIHRVSFQIDQIEKKIQRGQIYVSAITK